MGGSHSKHKLKGKYLAELRQRFPHINIELIVDWYREYMKLSKNKSKLKLEDFKNVYSKIFDDSAADLADHIFRAFDTNHDGKVDFEEFLMCLTVTDPSLGKDRDSQLQRLKWAFRVYDVDGNGTISRKEMRRIVQSAYCPSSIPVAWESSDDFADHLFSLVHPNTDDEITLVQFIAAADKDDTLLNLLMPCTDTEDRYV